MRWQVVGGEAEVAVDDAGVSEGVVGVEFDGVAEVEDRFFNAPAGVFAPVVTRFQVGLVGFGVLGVTSSDALSSSPVSLSFRALRSWRVMRSWISRMSLS